MKFFPCFTNKARILPENSAGYKHKKQINAYSSWICGADAGENVWFMYVGHFLMFEITYFELGWQKNDWKR